MKTVDFKETRRQLKDIAYVKQLSSLSVAERLILERLYKEFSYKTWRMRRFTNGASQIEEKLSDILSKIRTSLKSQESGLSITSRDGIILFEITTRKILTDAQLIEKHTKFLLAQQKEKARIRKYRIMLERRRKQRERAETKAQAQKTEIRTNKVETIQAINKLMSKLSISLDDLQSTCL